jgi:hypothetical protein
MSPTAIFSFRGYGSLAVALLTSGIKVERYALHLPEVIETRQQLNIDAFMQAMPAIGIGSP